MSDSSKAVFLSYASQDADAARCICESLRQAGVEVWLDQSELRGGDAWDARIREQIKRCALFIPLISGHTQERLEGYFRLEWHLAERRMQQMHEDAPFLLPVVIDPAAEDDPRVPSKFFDVQWMRLPGGVPTPAFGQRVSALLAGDGAAAQRRPALHAKTKEKPPGEDGTPLGRPQPRLQSAATRNHRPAVAANLRTNPRTKPERVLIIEDDPTMQRVLKDNFEFRGYDVQIAADGRKGVQAVFDAKPDVILLDIMLPEVNGFDVCRRIRQEGIATPIIMLTAKSQESDVVLGLNLGADDYVAKPFSLEILMARVSACLRRRGASSASMVEFGDCRLDAASHKLYRRDAEVPLTPKEFRLLEFFVASGGRALIRAKILEEVWGDDLIVTERSVDRCVNTLRTKIEPDPEHPTFIQTIRDVGYRFEAS